MATAIMTQKTVATPSNQERFFKFFQNEVIALQDRMQSLETFGTSGGERSDAVDFCLTGISKLTNDVKDASSYLPAYDQRTYSEAIKALTEKLQKIRQSFAPRAKFSFKTKNNLDSLKKNASAISLSDAAELAAQQRLSGPSRFSSTATSINPTPLDSPAPERAIDNDQDALGYDGSETDPLPTGAIRKPSFSKATRISISNCTNQHIILPPSASHATASATLSNIHNCVIDMTSASSSSSGIPFAALYLKNISDSLIICGQVDGAAHVTAVKRSVLVMGVRQFRMHESSQCSIYLHCASRPIVEDCHGLKFAPLPESHVLDSNTSTTNQYDQVDDFKWLKAEASPNWSVMQAKSQLSDHVWRDVVPGAPGVGHDVILKAVGVPVS